MIDIHDMIRMFHTSSFILDFAQSRDIESNLRAALDKRCDSDGKVIFRKLLIHRHW